MPYSFTIFCVTVLNSVLKLFPKIFLMASQNLLGLSYRTIYGSFPKINFRRSSSTDREGSPKSSLKIFLKIFLTRGRGEWPL